MKKNVTYLWIMYVSQDIPGNLNFDLERVTSTTHAIRVYRDFCRAVGAEECSASLYPYSAEAWAEAKEFSDAGCPFDYPSYLMERGSRGGVKVTSA